MIKKMLAGIVAATVMVLVAQPAPALATVKWTPAACATGSFDPVTVDRGHYFLTSHMSRCGPPASGANYEVVLFLPGFIPAAYGPNLRSYLQPDVTSEIILRTAFPAFAVCVMRAVDDLTACVRVDTATATSVPIPAGDPLLAEPVWFYEKVPVIHPNPYCGSCVTLYDA